MLPLWLAEKYLDKTGNTGFMHEGFDPNAPENFTRDWFAWANSMFGELIYRLYEKGSLARILAGG